MKKNFLAGLDSGDFAVINPAAKNWLDTTVNLRLHGETGKRPLDMFPEESSCFLPLPMYPYDTSTVQQVRAEFEAIRVLEGSRSFSHMDSHTE